MFGIGFGELLIIAVILIVAVGPDSMPKLFRAIGKGMREFRRASRELRSTIGIDEMMREEELKELRDLRSVGKQHLKDPFGINAAVKDSGKERKQALAPSRDGLGDEDRAREYPLEGVDLREAGAADEPAAGGAPATGSKPG